MANSAAQDTEDAGRPTPPPAIALDRARLRRVRRFFLGVVVHALWWDVLLARPLLRRLRTPPLERWSAIARRYRALAVELGGVLIKLGQFLSTRVDVLPVAVTRELAALQDEVPPAPAAPILAQVADDFGRPVEEVFPRFNPVPVAAASLAQVHPATLASGEEVVVKVLRPGIDVLVETDLAALGHAIRWLRRWRALRRRVDVEWLRREFVAVTRTELDLIGEGHRAERFAADMADEPAVVVPRVYWEVTARRTLTLEDVAAIRIADHAALDAAGVDRAAVARTLYRLFLKQLFVTHFVHADPHPGNIFVRPLGTPDGGASGGREFALAFVDFGMMAEIPERLRQGLREYAIGMGTRDARRIVDSYVTAGVLLPGADIERLVEAHQALLDRFWGVQLGDLRDVALREARDLAVQYRDLVFEAPFQVQGDMLFAMRAVGLMAGLATSLDPGFDPWAETVPFASRLAGEEGGGWQGWLEELSGLGHVLVELPRRLDRVLGRAERGQLAMETSLAPGARDQLTGLERAVDRLAWNVLGGALLIAAAVLATTASGGALPALLAAAGGVALIAGLLRR